ncbi:MAG: long-chain fatty acid--CoA ligase [Spirochaetes bacterium]|nr:MAG: long-chain fatty acid--CoA ligase [Spirochaetota bacterium]
MAEKKAEINSWDMLEDYRGEFFKGEWPTIPEQFHLSAHLYPEQTAFTQFSPEEVRITYREALEYVKNIASWLVGKGLKKGDRVILIGKNSPWWALGYLAALEAGGVIVPMDAQMEDETANRLITFAEARFLIADGDKHEVLGGKGSGIKHKISLSRGVGRFIGELPAGKTADFPETGEDDLAAILFTSGTTGLEKGVMLTHKNFITDVYQACHHDFLNADQSDVWYALLPLHHSYCMTAVFLEGIKHASEIVFAPAIVIDKIMKDLEFGGVTIFMGIPLLYNKSLKGMMKKVRAKGLFSHLLVGLLMRVSGFFKIVFKVNIGKKLFGNILLKKANLYNLKYLISGGGPLAPETVRRYQELGLDFVQGYGMTETAPISTLNPAHAFKISSVGKVFPLIEMEIHNPVEEGIGEVVIKGPICCKGYWKNEEATAELFDDEGWLHTGDLGYLDKENYLYLTGRSKNLIVSQGGKNIFPEEVEDHFQLYHQIDQIMVRGFLADEVTRAEGIEALIFPSREHYESLGTFESEAIRRDLIQAVKTVNRELHAYKRIDRIRIVEEALPTTSTRKIKRPVVDKLIPVGGEGFFTV